MLIKIAKTLFIILLAICSTIGFWYAITIILTAINPPYVILEDGSRGYVMNTENMFIGLILSVFVMLLVLLPFQSRIAEFIRK